VLSLEALDSNLHVAPFSNGGKVDIAAPGINVFSSWPRPMLHNTISGTSMATPHVTGCGLHLPATDVGAGWYRRLRDAPTSISRIGVG